MHNNYFYGPGPCPLGTHLHFVMGQHYVRGYTLIIFMGQAPVRWVHTSCLLCMPVSRVPQTLCDRAGSGQAQSCVQLVVRTCFIQYPNAIRTSLDAVSERRGPGTSSKIGPVGLITDSNSARQALSIDRL